MNGTTFEMDGGLFYEVPEIAELFGVREFTVCLWCRTGKLPAVWHKPTSRYGKWRVESKLVDALVEA